MKAEPMTVEMRKILNGLCYILYLVPVILIVSGLPLALQKVAPNGTYGFRTAQTLKSADMWYAVNTTGGLAFIAVGIISVGVIYALQQLLRVNPIITLIIGSILPVVLLLIAIAFSLQVS